MIWFMLYLMGALLSIAPVAVHLLKDYKSGEYEQRSHMLAMASPEGDRLSPEGVFALDMCLYVMFWPVMIPVLGLLHVAQ